MRHRRDGVQDPPLPRLVCCPSHDVNGSLLTALFSHTANLPILKYIAIGSPLHIRCRLRSGIMRYDKSGYS